MFTVETIRLTPCFIFKSLTPVNRVQNHIEVTYEKYTNYRNRATVLDTIQLPIDISASDFHMAIIKNMDIDGKPNLSWALTGTNRGAPIPHTFNTLVQVDQALEEVKKAMRSARTKQKGLLITNNVRLFIQYLS